MSNRDLTTDEVYDLTREMRQINEHLVLNAVDQHSVNMSLAVDLEQTRAVTEAMQYNVLWKQPEKLFPGLAVAVFYEPAVGDALVGGDFFDAFQLSNGSIVLAVGDVTGKGLQAASRTVEVKFALRAYALEYQNLAEIVGRLNRFICHFHDYDADAGDAFIVLSLVVINPLTGTMQAASAGAEPPFILRANGDVEYIAGEGLILGIDKNFDYKTADAFLDSGDSLLVTTDGLLEARRGHDFFGVERLIEFARQGAKSGTPYTMGKAILAAVHEHTKESLKDDICLLVAQRADV